MTIVSFFLILGDGLLSYNSPPIDEGRIFIEKPTASKTLGCYRVNTASDQQYITQSFMWN